MIKRILAALLTLVFMLSGFAAYAKEVPLPEANTDAEVLLPGFDWYCDYEALIKAAEANGLPTDPGSRVNMVGGGKRPAHRSGQQGQYGRVGREHFSPLGYLPE